MKIEHCQGETHGYRASGDQLESLGPQVPCLPVGQWSRLPAPQKAGRRPGGAPGLGVPCSQGSGVWNSPRWARSEMMSLFSQSFRPADVARSRQRAAESALGQGRAGQGGPPQEDVHPGPAGPPSRSRSHTLFSRPEPKPAAKALLPPQTLSQRRACCAVCLPQTTFRAPPAWPPGRWPQSLPLSAASQPPQEPHPSCRRGGPMVPGLSWTPGSPGSLVKFHVPGLLPGLPKPASPGASCPQCRESSPVTPKPWSKARVRGLWAAHARLPERASCLQHRQSPQAVEAAPSAHRPPPGESSQTQASLRPGTPPRPGRSGSAGRRLTFLLILFRFFKQAR